MKNIMIMLGKAKQIGTMLLIVGIISAILPVAIVSAEEQKTQYSGNSEANAYEDYRNYLSQHSQAEDASEAVNVAVPENGTEVSDGYTYDFEVNQSGFYNLKIIWKPQKSGTDIEFGIMIDGKYPFLGMENCELVRLWKNASEEPRKDASGNEYAQEQQETGEEIVTVIRDRTAIISEPYRIHLESGKHSISLIDVDQPITVLGIEFYPPEQVVDYAEYIKDCDPQKNDADIITVQAENADIKTSKSIIPKANTSNAGMTPSDPYKSKINCIGGTTWQTPGDTLTWIFNVEEAGYYSLNMRYMQSDLINGESHRVLRVNGKIPFSEANDLKFDYSTKWKYYTFADDTETPYLIWLDKGDNTISLEVSVGSQANYYYRLSDTLNIIGDLYLQIVMITSETPDLNRDYELFKQIPNFTDDLTISKENLESLAEDMRKAYATRSTQFIAAVENMVRVINNMLDNPYSAQMYLSDYYDNYSSLSSWLYDMNNMPLYLDELQLVPYGKAYVNKNAGFFKQQYYNIVRFASSFTEDYSLSESDGQNGEHEIKLWVTWGQDQASALNSLIEESFTYETGIKVNLQIVNASLINGLLTGNYPDVILQSARTEPVNLGMRGALTDLSQFSDCEEVLKRFAERAEIPYRYGDKLFALPDSQNFFLMFVRTDIFENLGLEIPKTWDEFIRAATIIQRNNMNVYLPYTQMGDATSVNGGLGSLHLFPTLISQNGLRIYNESKTATDITNEKVIDVFKYWTDFYKDYSILKTADFYNRFRAGTMPLGISLYSTYMTLYSAAPEIKGRWTIALVPGTDGGDNTVAGGGTGCAIVEKSKNKQDAWEFLKWWTSADTQRRYIGNVESTLGVISRPTTSNVEALNSLGWKSEDLKIINEQWSLVRELPEVPGSYYLIRSVDQAFWEVINGESNSRDALVKWSEIADEEIDRKIKEYS